MNLQQGAWRRRARPMLGTLVEIGTRGPGADTAIDAAFDCIAEGSRRLSRFEPGSEVTRFASLDVGASIVVHPTSAEILATAARLRDESDGLFDITLGRGPYGWKLDGLQLSKLELDVAFDLGGIAKGALVDAAVAVLQAQGCLDGWVNAGGDLRAFGRAELPIYLRDEDHGGACLFATLSDGAFATSAFSASSRSQVLPSHLAAHVSVAAPRCLWADALTKVVASSGDPTHPLVERLGAQAWRHAS